MSSGVFPDELKTAVVIPLFKKDYKLNPISYQPIALLSIFFKNSWVININYTSKSNLYFKKSNFFNKRQQLDLDQN